MRKCLQLPSTAVRRWISNWAMTHSIEAVISFNASWPIFVMTNLLGRAVHLLRADERPAILSPRDEADALALLERLRSQRVTGSYA